MKKLLTVVFALALVASVFVVGCSGGASASTDELVVVMGGEAVTLDPHGQNDQPSSRVRKQIYNTLVTQNEQMEVVPGLATSWEITDGGQTLTLKLREGVKFHNGNDFNAEDVKFSLERALASAHVKSIVQAIDPNGITIIDDYTVEIKMLYPFAPILAHLAHTAISIIDEEATTAGGDSYGQNPVGTGPYKFVEWIPGDSIVLTRFDEYWDEKAIIENVRMRVITENAARAIAVETGDAHIVYDIAPNDVARIEENNDLKMIRSNNFSSAYVGFNVQKEPFNDVRVRQAINLALDMESIVEAVYYGAGSPSKGPIVERVWAYNTDLPGYGYDLEEAKRLMAEAGYADGFETTIWVNDNQQRIDIAEIAQSQLAEIGITLNIEILEWAAYLERTAAGEHEMYILGWVTVTGDPDYGLYATFHTESFGAAGNRSFYSSPRVDELLTIGRTTGDPDARMDAYKEAQEIIFADAPWIFTWQGEDLNATSANVAGFVNNPAGHHRLDTVYFSE